VYVASPITEVIDGQKESTLSIFTTIYRRLHYHAVAVVIGRVVFVFVQVEVTAIEVDGDFSQLIHMVQM